MTGLIDPLEELDALQSEALARVRHLGSGKASRREIEETKQWGRQSAAHAEALMQASLLWDRLGPAGHNLLKRHGKPVLPSWTQSPQLSRRALLGGALACSAMAYAAVWPPLDLWPSAQALMADYRTAVGEKRDVTMSGGAELTLNTGTSINVQGDGKEDARRLEIVRGEAAVAIDSSSDREVVVVAGDGETRARHGQFNVRHEDGSTCVTCLDGDVQVARHANALTLRKGQQVNYASTGLGAPATVDPVEVAAWREGLLIFHYRPLTDVVAEINRYRPGRVMVLNSELGRRVVNGRFRVDNLDAIMNMFQQIFRAKLTRLPGAIVLLS